MPFLSGLDISASGLTAQRMRMDIISENLANIDTTRGENGEPYRRKYVVFEERNANFANVLSRRQGQTYGGVRVAEIGEDMSDFNLEYNPSHPDADESGYVRLPNVDASQEMVDMLAAYRAYEANITAFGAYKDMVAKTFQMGV